MFWKREHQARDEELDKVGRLLVRAAASSDEEADRAVSSPFAYARLRARIAAEGKQRAKRPSDWFATLTVACRALPAMLFVAVAAAGTFWFTAAQRTPVEPPGKAVSGIALSSIEGAPAAGACAISTAEECAISNNEVLATIFAEGAQEGPR